MVVFCGGNSYSMFTDVTLQREKIARKLVAPQGPKRIIYCFKYDGGSNWGDEETRCRVGDAGQTCSSVVTGGGKIGMSLHRVGRSIGGQQGWGSRKIEREREREREIVYTPDISFV